MSDFLASIGTFIILMTPLLFVIYHTLGFFRPSIRKSINEHHTADKVWALATTAIVGIAVVSAGLTMIWGPGMVSDRIARIGTEESKASQTTAPSAYIRTWSGLLHGPYDFSPGEEIPNGTVVYPTAEDIRFSKRIQQTTTATSPNI